ncbi:MAG: hypothetical protein O9339_19335 [Rubrivivax sp.]|nr:hypothetical protein [Rubrivivax sp.]
MYALFAAALLLYVGWVACQAWGRFGLSGTFVVYTSIALLFLFLGLFTAWLSFAFSRRAVTSLQAIAGGFELHLATTCAQDIQVSRLTHIRTFGKQFANNEAAPAYVLFAAAGRVWVTEASVYRAANREARR